MPSASAADHATACRPTCSPARRALSRQPGMLERCGSLQRRYAAIAGLSAEHMGRTAAWRFHDLGRRIERAGAMVRATRAFGLPVPRPTT
ncbi:alpha-E domain-containing protein [Sphingomonas sp. MMS24-JH45]